MGIKSNLANKIELKPQHLQEVKPVKTTSYSDIDLNSWKDYPQIETGTWWEFATRAKGNGHSFDYHGNYIPQLAEQLFTRFTKENDIILDMFLGSGTSAIEALNMGRRCVGVELNPNVVKMVEDKFSPKDLVTGVRIINGDSASDEIKDKIDDTLELMRAKKAQFLVLHPPYDDIIKFSETKEDLSNCSSTDEFVELFGKVAQTGYDALEKGRFAALIIGDKYADSQLIPLGFMCMAKMQEAGFITKSIIVKNIEGNEKAKGKTANLWRYRALAGGFYIFKHEYVILFQKKK
ncbi:MAG: DNA methyltransferase [Candidatus Gastranaerophilales bacterium]|nr:DNA methyltransferase [Candidatus Gastranaerophilales bacterium]